MNETADNRIGAFRDAIRAGDVQGARQLLGSADVRARVNDPLFDFGRRAAHVAATNVPMLTVLIDAGADVNLKSEWKNGPYTVLDEASDASARFLLTQGAVLTPNVAARLGWLDDLRRLIDADRALVHARGGDGQQPLHEARTVAIAALLLERGAGIDVRCIDHHSTPAQYALAARPDVCRFLLERGATPDIFMAARLGDDDLATRLLDADPGCIAVRINTPGYTLVPPFSIYCWSLGFGLSPFDVASKFGHTRVRDLLDARSPARARLINAVTAGDSDAARAMLESDPTLLESLPPPGHGHLALAIFHERFEAANAMLDIGFDATVPGVDGGTALHAACWVGNVQMVDRILAQGRVPLDARDPTHGSTPLGWAAFGSAHRRASGANYPAVVERLVAAGADITSPGNGDGLTLLQMAAGNAGMQDALRRAGAAS